MRKETAFTDFTFWGFKCIQNELDLLVSSVWWSRSSDEGMTRWGCGKGRTLARKCAGIVKGERLQKWIYITLSLIVSKPFGAVVGL